jgi:hypothetical protein
MAAKTRTKKSKATLDSVLSTVERGFADLEGKMERGFAAVAEDITDIKQDGDQGRHREPRRTANKC